MLILVGVYFYIADPLNLKPLISNTKSESKSTESAGTPSYLSESQEKALKTFGIDPASVPSEITPEQEACFEAKLGEERVAEIKAGDSPTATEYFNAKDCM